MRHTTLQNPSRGRRDRSLAPTYRGRSQNLRGNRLHVQKAVMALLMR